MDCFLAHSQLEEQKDQEHPKKSLLSQMAQRDWWKNTVTWIRPLHVGTKDQNGTNNIGDEHEQFPGQQFHVFYQTLVNNQDNKVVSTRYPNAMVYYMRQLTSVVQV